MLSSRVRAVALVVVAGGAVACAGSAKAEETPSRPRSHLSGTSRDVHPKPYDRVTFAASDGLTVTADLYLRHPATAPFIVLFHQAGWSRGEYREIAPRLVALGFNCLAVDQRSGGKVSGVVNETHRAAKAAARPTTFVDAIADMRAALTWARKNHASGKLIAWGSSYSAGLVLRLGADASLGIDAILAFAPGEYFARFGKPKDWVRTAAASLTQPVFITSAKNERPKWSDIFAAIPSPEKFAFVPMTEGHHGSRALWRKFPDSTAYWTHVETFLARARSASSP